MSKTVYTIGIIGMGFVGNATKFLFELGRRNNANRIRLLEYDQVPEKCVPFGVTLEQLVTESDLICICIPTPTSLSTNECIVEPIATLCSSIKQILQTREGKDQEEQAKEQNKEEKEQNEEKGQENEEKIAQRRTFVALRSTVPPGTCDRLSQTTGLPLFFMPEFLTEKNWKTDTEQCHDMIVGLPFLGCVGDFGALLGNTLPYDKEVHFASNSEAELVKYMRNSFLAVKISFFNEMEQFARAKGIDYEAARELAVLDERLGSSHTLVPGPDQKRGYAGSCLPKDIQCFATELEKVQVKPFMLRASIKRNFLVDRPEREWLMDPRSFR